MADPYQDLMRSYAARLRADDRTPTSRFEWEHRAKLLREKILAAAGPMHEKPSSLAPQILGELKRPGYVIERLIFQSRPDMWITANLYRPDPMPDKCPSVLVVHGHWSLARIDPVVQSRCLGLVKLGFTVLAVDAFGSGERFSEPAPGTYHGALYGGTLWPVGQTLLGLQIYDNRRAVDYLLTRPGIDPERIGITGASGGGNQSMYAGAFDQRLKAVVPVCSVGNYQAYLLVACCVCEVLPSALTFTEEGDVLGLIAPRSLLVINAAKDSVQFSPAEAEKCLQRARSIYSLLGVGDRIANKVFDAEHGFDKAMREAMYGWMARWLKNEGKGDPIPEPQFSTEDPSALKCYPDIKTRPSAWFFPPTLARQVGREMLINQFPTPPSHVEEWESTAVFMRSELARCLGPMPAMPKTVATVGQPIIKGPNTSVQVTLPGEPGLPVELTFRHLSQQPPKPPACVVLSLDGSESALNHPLNVALIKAGWSVAAPDLRATGAKLTKNMAVGNAKDHNPAEHGVWVGRPLLGQWLWEVQVVVDWLRSQPINRERLFIAGIGGAGIVAIVSAALLPNEVSGAITSGMPSTYLTDVAYGDVWRMGLLVPNILKVGDIAHLAALIAPRRLVIADGVDPQGNRLRESKLIDAFAFTSSVFKAAKSNRLTVTMDPNWDEMIARL